MDMEIELIVKDKNNCIINGLLTREYVSKIVSEGDEFISLSDTPVFDFNQLETCDSSSIALLIHWWRTASTQGKKIQFVNLSPKMLAIIQISEISDILKLF